MIRFLGTGILHSLPLLLTPFPPFPPYYHDSVALQQVTSPTFRYLCIMVLQGKGNGRKSNIILSRILKTNSISILRCWSNIFQAKPCLYIYYLKITPWWLFFSFTLKQLGKHVYKEPSDNTSLFRGEISRGLMVAQENEQATLLSNRWENIHIIRGTYFKLFST